MNGLEALFLTYGSWAVFAGSILEQIIAPIPSSIVVLGSSFIIMKGLTFTFTNFQGMFLKITIPAAMGVTIGSCVYYGLVYKIGTPFIEKTGKYLGVSSDDIENLEHRVKKSKYESLFLFLARCIPIIPSIAISLFCGLIKYPPRKYITITFFGALIQATILGIVGWQFGNFYLKISESIGLIDNIILVILILMVAYFIIKKKLKR